MKIAIVGAGKLGLRVAEVLMGGVHSVTLIDKSEELMHRLSSTLDVAIVTGNAKEASLLKSIGIGGFDYFIAVTGSDEKNIVIGTIAKRLGVPKVIVRIRDPEHKNQYELLKETFGVDHIVNPDRSVAEEINKYLLEKYSFQGGILRAGSVSILEFMIDKKSDLIGRRASQVRENLRSTDLSLAAVSKNGKLVIPWDWDGLTIEKDDVLYIAGAHDAVDRLTAKYIERERHTDIRRVMIAGGGNAGFYLASMLERFGVSVKIIEIDKNRCQYLSTHLQNVLVLNGDATDLELLNDEDFSEMNAFISATGFDEENLLLALMAKQAGIEDVIAKISRESFETLVTGMGVDMVLNPIDISASHIVRYIKDTAILSSQIIQGQAELVLVEVGNGMSMQGKSIGGLGLPHGLSIIALQRGPAVILPDDKTKIIEGDRLVILSLLSESFDLEKLLRKHGFFS